MHHFIQSTNSLNHYSPPCVKIIYKNNGHQSPPLEIPPICLHSTLLFLQTITNGLTNIEVAILTGCQAILFFWVETVSLNYIVFVLWNMGSDIIMRHVHTKIPIYHIHHWTKYFPRASTSISHRSTHTLIKTLQGHILNHWSHDLLICLCLGLGHDGLLLLGSNVLEGGGIHGDCFWVVLLICSKRWRWLGLTCIVGGWFGFGCGWFDMWCTCSLLWSRPHRCLMFVNDADGVKTPLRLNILCVVSR